MSNKLISHQTPTNAKPERGAKTELEYALDAYDFHKSRAQELVDAVDPTSAPYVIGIPPGHPFGTTHGSIPDAGRMSVESDEAPVGQDDIALPKIPHDATSHRSDGWPARPIDVALHPNLGSMADTRYDELCDELSKEFSGRTRKLAVEWREDMMAKNASLRDLINALIGLGMRQVQGSWKDL
ncbi:hypothetical protein HGRIS_003196 [Hohenbuehelia grisea]|uniref:Uncharacterized protein n=1 Tax=Hohenbuehelia grisea TaxID=104357 RepID=A0ABR3JP02_9AGAR